MYSGQLAVRLKQMRLGRKQCRRTHPECNEFHLILISFQFQQCKVLRFEKYALAGVRSPDCIEVYIRSIFGRIESQTFIYCLRFIHAKIKHAIFCATQFCELIFFYIKPVNAVVVVDTIDTKPNENPLEFYYTLTLMRFLV